MEARELVDGGAYGMELLNEVVRDKRRSGWVILWGLKCGGKVVER